MDANDLLLGSVGGRAAKFEEAGTVIGGHLIAEPRSEQQKVYGEETLKFDSQGRPEMQVVITLQTAESTGPEDDGMRNIYAKGNMLRAIGKAMLDAGSRKLEIGGTLYVKYLGDIPAKNPKHKPAKTFAASYTPPAPQVSQILAEAASQPEMPGQSSWAQAARNPQGNTVFENQHRAQDVPARPMSTLEQMRHASQNPAAVSGPPF